MFDNLDDDDDAPAPAQPQPQPQAAPKTSAVFADDDAEDPLSNAPAPAAAPPALPKPRVSAAAAVKTVDAASSSASQFTGVSRRGSTLFNGSDADVLSGGASDIFIPSEARGQETGIDSNMAVEALDDSLLCVADDDIDALFADQAAAAAPARKDRLGLLAPQPGAVGNRNAAVASLFGPTAKVSASATAAALGDDDDDLFGDIGSQSSADGALGGMSALSLQEYIAKQKSRFVFDPQLLFWQLTPPLQQHLRRIVRLTSSAYAAQIALSRAALKRHAAAL
jgi:hypothetical protein